LVIGDEQLAQPKNLYFPWQKNHCQVKAIIAKQWQSLPGNGNHCQATTIITGQ